MRKLRTISVFLQIVSIILTGISILLQAALTNKDFTDWILPKWPPYLLAMDGISILKDLKYSVPIYNESFEAGLLNIDQPSWKVILDFVKSDIASKKSGRGEQEYLERPQPPPPESSATPPPEPNATLEPVSRIPAPPINFERIKSIVSLRTKAGVFFGGLGGKAVTSLYILSVFWPPNISRTVYEFASFEEFRLDLRRMIIDQLDGHTKWLALGGFISALVFSTLRWVAGRSRTQNVSP